MTVRWLALWIGLGALTVAVAVNVLVGRPRGEVRLYTRALPGFDIDVPGEDGKKDGSGYANGQLSIDNPGGFPVSLRVNWEAGGLLDDDEVEMVSKAQSPSA